MTHWEYALLAGNIYLVHVVENQWLRLAVGLIWVGLAMFIYPR